MDQVKDAGVVHLIESPQGREQERDGIGRACFQAKGISDSAGDRGGGYGGS